MRKNQQVVSVAAGNSEGLEWVVRGEVERWIVGRGTSEGTEGASGDCPSPLMSPPTAPPCFTPTPSFLFFLNRNVIDI